MHPWGVSEIDFSSKRVVSEKCLLESLSTRTERDVLGLQGLVLVRDGGGDYLVHLGDGECSILFPPSSFSVLNLGEKEAVDVQDLPSSLSGTKLPHFPKICFEIPREGGV